MARFSIPCKIPVLACILAAGLASSPVQAVPILTFSDNDPGTPDLVVTDQDFLLPLPNDLGPMPGTVVFVGSLGVWSSIIVTGQLSGSSSLPSMLLSWAATSSSAGQLSIDFTADGLGPTNATASGDFSATFLGANDSNSVTYGTEVNGGPSILSHTFFGPGADHYPDLGDPPAEAPLVVPSLYSLTQTAVINHEEPATSSGAYRLTTVPDGGTTFIMFGLMVCGLETLRRKMRLR